MQESSLAFLNRASILVLKGLVQDALLVLEEAVEKFPFDPRPLERSADLYLSLGRAQDSVRAYLAAADLYAQMGAPLRTLELCKRVLEIEPQNPQAHRIVKNAPTGRDTEDLPISLDGFDAEGLFLENAEVFESDQTSVSPPPSFEEETDTAQSANAEVSSLSSQGEKTFEVEMALPPEELLQDEPTPYVDPSPKSSAPISPLFSSPRSIRDTQPQEAPPFPEAGVSPEPTATPGKAVASMGGGARLSNAPSQSRGMLAPSQGQGRGGRFTYASPPLRSWKSRAVVFTPKLPSIPLFAELPPRAFREVLGGSIQRRFRPGEIIFREGEPGCSCFFLLSGEVEVWRALPGGRRSLACLGAGDFFGEMALLSQLPRSANVEARRETELFEVPGELLMRLAAEHKSVETVLHRFYKRRVLDYLSLSDPLFHTFSPEEREALVRSFWVREGKPKDRLLTEGAYANGFYVVLSAVCEMSARGKLGQSVPLQILRTGDYFGGGSILEKRPSLVTVQVIKPGRLLYFPKKTFYDLVNRHPSARSAVAPLLAERRGLVERAKRGEPIFLRRIEMP